MPGHLKVAAAALTLAIGAAALGGRAQAAAFLAAAGSGAPLADLDGAVGIADAEVAPNSPVVFDIIYSSALAGETSGGAAGVEWRFTLSNVDPGESAFYATAGAFAPGLPVAASSVSFPSLGAVGFTYTLAAALSDGDLIGTVGFPAEAVEMGAGDDLADPAPAGDNVLIWDAVGATTASSVS